MMIAFLRTKRPGLGLLAAAALVLAGAGCASTGSVAGRVDTAGKHKTADQAVSAARADSSKARSKNHSRAVLELVDGQFTPSVLLVDPGTEVRIENHDRIWHNAFSVASTAPFDVGSIAPGKSASVLLAKSGVVKVFCEFHKNESATIVVARSHARVRPMPDGTDQLGSLPAGIEKVSAWHPS